MLRVERKSRSLDRLKMFLAWMGSVFLCAYVMVVCDGRRVIEQTPPRGEVNREQAPHQQVTYEATTECSPEQALKQGKLIEAAKIRGCPSEDDAWLRIFHLLVPTATVVVDIGSNKGYTAARIFELWNPEIGLDAIALHDAIKATATEKELRECGACSDCMGVSIPLMSIPIRTCSVTASHSADANYQGSLMRAVDAICLDRKTAMKPVRVFSFDGNPTMIDGVTRARDYFINSLLKKSLPGVMDIPFGRLPKDSKRLLKDYWHLELAAFSEKYVPGATIEFAMGKGEMGHVVTEITKEEVGLQKVVVPLLSVDELVRRERLVEITILKIDTEGHDPNVLRGAKQTLRDHLATLVIFEYNVRWETNESLGGIITELFDGYACYSEGKNALAKLTQSCWTKHLELRRWSNVWCVSLQSPDGRAVAWAFDKYSLAFL